MQIPWSFFRDEERSDPPLAEMLRGGRGGAVRLKLYLTMCLVATKAPYRIKDRIPARVWAEMLDLPDPTLNGARRVNDALDWLHDHQYIDLRRSPGGGAPPTLRLLSPSGDGAKLVRPRKYYVRVTVGLWKYGWIATLTGRALAVLLDLLDLQGGRSRSNPPSMSGNTRARYGLSTDTWRRGERELKDAGLLTVKRAPQGEDFDWRRMRNVYWVDEAILNAPRG